MFGIVLLLFLVVLMVGAMPHWGWSRSYGYGYWPSGIILVIVVILAVLLLSGSFGDSHWRI